MSLRGKDSSGAECFVKHFRRLVCAKVCQEKAQMFSRKLHLERQGERSERVALGRSELLVSV